MTISAAVVAGGLAFVAPSAGGSTRPREAVAEPQATSKICGAADGTWQQIPTTSSVAKGGFVPQNMLLLTNGTVMVQQQTTGNWFDLVPDKHGCYDDGTWKQLASMPAGYGPLYDASQVLDNGDVLVEGGEENDGVGTVFSKQGALYDPTTNSWTPVSPPASGWNGGDIASVVLPNGQFMMSNVGTGGAFLLNQSTMTWTPLPGNDSDMDEEGWSLLQNGNVFTIDTESSNTNAFNDADESLGEMYIPSTQRWTPVGYSPDILGSGCSIPSRRTGTASDTIDNDLAVAECPQDYWLQGGYTGAGETITFLYFLANYSNHTISDVQLSSDRTHPKCPEKSLAAGASMTCTGTYVTTASDLTNDACSSTTSCVKDASAAAGTLEGVTVDSNTATTSVPKTSCSNCNNGEIGPQVVLPDGDVFAVGASGYNALYDPASNTWSTSAAMDFPQILASRPAQCGDTSTYTWQQAESFDNAMAVLPDGDVLVPGGSGAHCPLEYFQFNGTSLSPLPSSSQPSVEGTQHNDGDLFLLDLPTGQVLATNEVNGDYLELYTDTHAPNPAWEPNVTSLLGDLSPGGTSTVVGTQLNGLTEATGYGDDMQDSTDYPILKLTASNGVVTYAHTFDFSTRTIDPGAPESAQFTVPDTAPVGPSTLQVVANGIASPPVSVNVYGQQKVPTALTTAAPAVAIVGGSSTTASPCGTSQCYVLAWEGQSGNSLWWDTAPAEEDQGSYDWSGGRQVPDVGTSAGPALGVLGGDLGGNLVMAWKGESDWTMWFSSLDGTTWSPQQRVPDAGTSTTPALAGTTLACPSGGPTGPILFLAWKGEGTDTRVFYAYTTNGSTWTIVGQVPTAATDSAPSLTVENRADVILSWKAAGETTIDQSVLDFCQAGARWTSPSALSGKARTSAGPGTATDAQGTASFAVWKGGSDDRIFTNEFTSTFHGSLGEPVLNVLTSTSPSLATQPLGSSADMLMAWKGASDNQIWVGPLDLMASG